MTTGCRRDIDRMLPVADGGHGYRLTPLDALESCYVLRRLIFAQIKHISSRGPAKARFAATGSIGFLRLGWRPNVRPLGEAAHGCQFQPVLEPRAVGKMSKGDHLQVEQAAMNEKVQAASSKQEAALKPKDGPMRPILVVASLLLFAPHAAMCVWKYFDTVGKPSAFAGTPIWEPIVGSILYAFVVFGGPWAMRTFQVPSLPIRELMLAYNMYEVVLNGVVVAMCGYGLYAHESQPFWGGTVDNSAAGHMIAYGTWLHYVSKYIECLDTVFFVLRRNFRFLSPLHCWHHAIMCWPWWCAAVYACGGDTWFGCALNSGIHVLMYTYYGLKVARNPITSKLQMGMTVLQLVQFLAGLIHAVYLLSLTPEVYPKWITTLELLIMVNMLIMFGQFFASTYCKGRDKGKGKVNGKGKKDEESSEAPARVQGEEALAQQVRSSSKPRGGRKVPSSSSSGLRSRRAPREAQED